MAEPPSAPSPGRREVFNSVLRSRGVGLAYFFGSQGELGPRVLEGREVSGAPASDLDLGVVLLEHPLDYWAAEAVRRDLHQALAPLFAPLQLHVLLLELENAHVQYAAIRGVPAYEVDEEFARRYRGQVLTLYGDWHSWW